MCPYPWIFDPIRSGQIVEKSVDWIMNMDMDKIRFFLNGYGLDMDLGVSDPKPVSDSTRTCGYPIQSNYIRSDSTQYKHTYI